MKKTIALILTALSVSAHAQIYEAREVDLVERTAPDLEAFQANYKSYTWTVKNNDSVADITGATPFMYYYAKGETGIVSATCATLVATSGTFTAVFEQSDLNPDFLGTVEQDVIYGVGITFTNGSTTVKQGQLTIIPDPFSAGVDATTFSSIVNWALYTWLNVPSESDPVFTNLYAQGLDLSTMTNAPSAWTAADTGVTNVLSSDSSVAIAGTTAQPDISITGYVAGVVGGLANGTNYLGWYVVGDGLQYTNVLDAVNAAGLVSSTSAPTTVFITDGIYDIGTNFLSLASGMTVIGAGHRSTIIRGTPAMRRAGIIGSHDTNGVSNIRIADIGFEPYGGLDLPSTLWSPGTGVVGCVSFVNPLNNSNSTQSVGVYNVMLERIRVEPDLPQYAWDVVDFYGVNGDNDQQITIRDCELHGRQDVLTINETTFLVEGNVIYTYATNLLADSIWCMINNGTTNEHIFRNNTLLNHAADGGNYGLGKIVIPYSLNTDIKLYNNQFRYLDVVGGAGNTNITIDVTGSPNIVLKNDASDANKVTIRHIDAFDSTAFLTNESNYADGDVLPAVDGGAITGMVLRTWNELGNPGANWGLDYNDGAEIIVRPTVNVTNVYDASAITTSQTYTVKFRYYNGTNSFAAGAATWQTSAPTATNTYFECVADVTAQGVSLFLLGEGAE